MNNDNYWASRRTIRKYTSQPVSDLVIDSIIQLASQAPTTGNMQLYSVVVTKSPELLEALRPTHFNQPASQAPVLLTFCADLNRFSQWCKLSDAQPGFDNFQSFISALLDTTIFAQQFTTIAEQQGLGVCYLGTTTYNAPDIARILNLPKGVIPVVTLSLGYPDETGIISDRLPIYAIRHSETYHTPTDNEIQQLYAPKEALPENQKFVAENNKKTLAQVFTDVRYTKANNEHFSKVSLDFLRLNNLIP